MADFYKYIDILLEREGVYDNDPDDPGGETVYGITRRDHGDDPIWVMVDAVKRRFWILKPSFAIKNDLRIRERAILHYKTHYWDKIRGDDIKSQLVAEEVFDTAVNCGVGTAIGFLERVLNLGNRDQVDYPDINIDKKISDEDLTNLQKLIDKRGEKAVVKALNVLQGARYIEICEANPRMEKYFWGWIVNRA